MTARTGRKPGNKNWGKASAYFTFAGVEKTAFERVVEQYKLKPDQYVRSTRLKEWARKHRNHRYVPEDLLTAWGMEVHLSGAIGELKLPGARTASI